MTAMTQVATTHSTSTNIDSQLVGNAHRQSVSHNAATTSRADRYKKAYAVEVYKVKKLSDINNSMGYEIDILHKTIERLEERSQGLDKDLTAYAGKTHDLKEKNNELLCIVLEQDEANANLEQRVVDLEAKLKGQSNAESKSDLDLVVSDTGITGIQSPDQLGFSLKRRHSADEGYSDGRKQPKKTRKR
jgi:hypothetical protein